jgi:hypothetical protein
MSAISRSFDVLPAAIAGVTFKVLMDAHEIVVHEVDRHHMRVVRGFL